MPYSNSLHRIHLLCSPTSHPLGHVTALNSITLTRTHSSRHQLYQYPQPPITSFCPTAPITRLSKKLQTDGRDKRLCYVYQCKICMKTLKQKSSVSRHYRLLHNINLDEIDKEKDCIENYYNLMVKNTETTCTLVGRGRKELNKRKEKSSSDVDASNYDNDNDPLIMTRNRMMKSPVTITDVQHFIPVNIISTVAPEINNNQAVQQPQTDMVSLVTDAGDTQDIFIIDEFLDETDVAAILPEFEYTYLDRQHLSRNDAI